MTNWNLQNKGDIEAYLNIGDGFQLLIGDGYKLKIQEDTPLTNWSLQTKN